MCIRDRQKIGISLVELHSQTAEAMAGAPAAVGGGGAGPGARGGEPTLNADGLLPRCATMAMVIDPPPSSAVGAGRGRSQTSEQEAAAQRLRDWRAATTPATWQAVRKKFNDAGIEVRTMFYSLGFQGAPTSDEDIDYAFRMAKGLGVRAMSGSSTIPIAKRIAVAAEKYKMPWGGHTQDNVHDPDQFVTPESYEGLLALSRWFRINFDIGYFTAAGFDAVPFLLKNHAKITSIHLKDRKRSRSLGGDITNNTINNYPWGQGDTPIREVLQLMKKEQWDIPVLIEYDYACRTTADTVTEIRKCYEYAKNCLEA